MKRFIFVALFFFLIFFSNFTPTKAQVSQNIILSCLDATKLDEIYQTIDGVFYHHLLSLKNRDLGVFNPEEPIYIIRSLPRVFCDPNSNDPDCVKDPQTLTPCIQEIIGADICNQNCPWDGHICQKDNDGPGNTVCCMPSYTKQGPYFECANDKNGQLVCPQSVMAEPGQNNGIHPAEDGHVETGYASSILLVNNDKNSLVADPEGNIFIPIVQSFTRAGLEHSFYGMQLLSDQAITDNDAFHYSLKLALFSQTETVEPSAVNCTTVYWDPYGKVIDSLRLEPIYNLPVLLKNLDSQNKVVQTTVPNNPAFKNPELTDIAGNFNFAVLSGTYFLEPLTSDFNFPLEQGVLQTALSYLQTLDPNQQYIKTDKVYNSLTEPIVERAGFSERRDIILEPKDPNYQGSTPIILYAENLRHEDNQLIRGRVSHPKSIVKIYLADALVAQVDADLEGSFTATIPQTLLNTNPGQFTIYAEKVALLPNSQTINKNNFWDFLIKSVLAQQNNVSRPYMLSPVPIRVSGFVFNTAIQVEPKTVVKLTSPSLGGIVYSQTISDENGYININQKNLPPFDFVLTVSPQQKETYQLTINDFNKTNSVFFDETGQSLYNNRVASSKPSQALVDKVLAETPKKISPKDLSFNQPQITPTTSTTTTATKTENNLVFVVVFVAMLALVILAAFVIIQHNKRKEQAYY